MTKETTVKILALVLLTGIVVLFLANHQLIQAQREQIEELRIQNRMLRCPNGLGGR